MSLPVILAVHKSRIEPRLRHLAQTLAIFARREDGSEIFPGAALLMQAMGVHRRAVQNGLHGLLATGVLVRDGFHGHVRKFRFDLAALAAYEPVARHPRSTSRGATGRRHPTASRHGDRSGTVHRGAQLNDSQLCTTVHPSEPVLHKPEPTNCAPRCAEVCTPVRVTVHHGAHDLNDLKDLTKRKITDADASARTHEEPHPSPTTEPRPSPTSDDAKPVPTYDEIATDALTAATRERNVSPGNVAAHFARRCAARGLACDEALTRRALDAAIARRDHAGDRFVEQARVAGRITPRPRKR